MNRLHLATTGLFAAWMVRDLEELATMSANSRALVRRLPAWVPVAASVRERGFTQRYVATDIRAVGVVIATAPTVVVPFWLCAGRALRNAAVPNRRSLPTAIALTAGTIAGGRLAAYAITKNQP
jgi:hypothetical protein